MTQTAAGHLDEARASLKTAATAGAGRDPSACAGLVMGNMASMMSILGRLADAERLADESVRILERFYPPDDWALLHPLQILAAVRLELGKTAKAREALKRIQSIRIRTPEDRASIHATLGALLQIEGRLGEAEAEYQVAMRAWEKTGRSESADAAAILHCLGSLYLKEHRLEESRRVLERAMAIYERANDAVPADRIKLLDLRGVLHARLDEWQQSQQDLSDALSLLDHHLPGDSPLLRSVLDNYLHVLRKNHHRQEAKSIEARIAALPTDPNAEAVVDVTDLLVERKPTRRP